MIKLKLTIYTRFPNVVADLLESHYKHIVTPEYAEMIGPIEQDENSVEFTYSGNTTDDPIYSWLKWNMNGGLIRSHKLEKI